MRTGKPVMYQVHRRTHKHRKFLKRSIILLILLLVGAVIFFLLRIQIQPEQEITNAPPVSTAYNPPQQRKISVDATIMTMELPEGWKALPIPNSPTAPKHSFVSPSSRAQSLDVYIDNPPTGMGINKAVAVDVENGIFSHESVSDNCVTYTDVSKRNAVGQAPAKWQGRDFMCDVGNSSRALVGIVSTDGLNFTTVRMDDGTEHKLFITYIDNNINPDYNVLYEIFNSIKFK